MSIHSYRELEQKYERDVRYLLEELYDRERACSSFEAFCIKWLQERNLVRSRSSPSPGSFDMARPLAPSSPLHASSRHVDLSQTTTFSEAADMATWLAQDSPTTSRMRRETTTAPSPSSKRQASAPRSEQVNNMVEALSGVLASVDATLRGEKKEQEVITSSPRTSPRLAPVTATATRPTNLHSSAVAIDQLLGRIRASLSDPRPLKPYAHVEAGQAVSAPPRPLASSSPLSSSPATRFVHHRHHLVHPVASPVQSPQRPVVIRLADVMTSLGL